MAVDDSLTFWTTLFLFLQYSTEIGTLWGRAGYELWHIAKTDISNVTSSVNGTDGDESSGRRSCLDSSASTEPLLYLSSFQCGFNILLFIPIVILLYVYAGSVGNDGRVTIGASFLRELRAFEIAIVLMIALLTLLNFVITYDLLVIGEPTFLGYDYRVQVFIDLFGYINMFLLIKLLANFGQKQSPFLGFAVCWNVNTEAQMYILHTIFAVGIFSRQATLFHTCPDDLSAQTVTNVLMSLTAMLEEIVVMVFFDMIWFGEAVDPVRPFDKIVWFFAGLFNVVRRMLCKMLLLLTRNAKFWYSSNLCMNKLMRFFYFSQIVTWILTNLLSSTPAHTDYLDVSSALIPGVLQLVINVFILLVTYLHHYNVIERAGAKWHEWLWNTTPLDCRHRKVEVTYPSLLNGDPQTNGNTIYKINPCACKDYADFYYYSENLMKSGIASLVFLTLNAILIARACILEEQQFALHIPLIFTTYACMFVTFPHLQATPNSEDPDYAGDKLLWKLHFAFTLLVFGADVLGMTVPSHIGPERFNVHADNMLHFFQRVTESLLSVKFLLMLLWTSPGASGYSQI